MRNQYRQPIEPPRPGDVVLWLGAQHRDVVHAIVLGRDRTGAPRIHVGEYYRPDVGRLRPKRGVSLTLDDYRAMHGRLEKAYAEMTSLPAKPGDKANDPAA